MEGSEESINDIKVYRRHPGKEEGQTFTGYINNLKAYHQQLLLRSPAFNCISLLLNLCPRALLKTKQRIYWQVEAYISRLIFKTLIFALRKPSAFQIE